MVSVSTSVLLVEGASENGCCICVPTMSLGCLLPLWKLSEISKWVLPSFLLNYHLYNGTQSMWFCVFPLRVETLFPLALRLSLKQDSLAFKAKHSRVLSSQCRTPRLGSLMWGSDSLFLEVKLCSCDYPLICRSPTQWCGYWLYCVSAPSYSSCGFFFISLVVENFFCSSSGHFKDRCSVNSCNFGVLR